MGTTWMVRAGGAGYLIDEFRNKGLVAIGWKDLGDLSRIPNRDALRRRVEDTYADASAGWHSNATATVWKFIHDIKPGDAVISYDTSKRSYLVGQVVDGYGYDERKIEGYPNVHSVKWTGSVNRDDLSVTAKNSLGAIQTLFVVPPDVCDEIAALLKGEKRKTTHLEEDVELDTIKNDTQSSAREFIKDLIMKLSWEEMQDLVSGLLKAMGYKSTVSARGADRGKDIIASPDGLGLEHPRIRAEVKHRPRQPMGAPDLRSFLGALRSSDRGLYISTGGFSNEAHYEAERSNIPVTLIDMDSLVQLLEQNYEKLDVETRSLVPLIRVYWPADLKSTDR